MIEFTLLGVHLKIWATQVLGLCGMALFVWFLWRAQQSKDNPIDFATMLVWPGTGQTSLILVGTLAAMLTATWIIVDLALRNHLTPEYFLAYVGTMIFGKGATEFINAWRDRGPNPPAQNMTQNIDKAAVVSSAPAPNPPPAVPPDQKPILARPRKQAKTKRERLMKRQRGFGLIEIAVYAIVAVVVAGVAWKVWNSFKESIAKPYVDAQITADKIIVKEANDSRDDYKARSEHAASDLGVCQTSANVQNGQVDYWKGEAAKAEKESQDAKAAALIANAGKQSAMSENQRLARTKDATVKSCQDQLDGVAAKLREGARSRLPGAK